MKRISLRLRVTAIATAVVALTLVVTGLIVTRWLRASLLSDTDSALSGQVTYVAALSQVGELSPVLSASGIDVGQVQVISSGRVLAVSPGLAATARLDVFPAPAVGQQAARTVTGPLFGGQGTTHYRIFARTVHTPIGDVTVYAASSLRSVDRAVDALVLGLWVGLPSLTLLAALGIWLVVGRSLSPVEQMRREVAAIDGPEQRISARARATELEQLATTMNDLLDRVDQAAATRRQFLADASHELRSPLASARTQLEVGLAYPDGADWPATAREVLVDVERLQALAGELLDLAKVEASERVPAMETVQLDALVAAEAERYADARLATTLEPVQVRGDRQLLVRLVRNLVDNARRHAVHEVRVQLTAAADGAVLRVWNDGAPIAAADRERIFDPFTRLDEARARDDGGAGLGLSIARRICALHDGTLALDAEASEPAGVAFVVRLPRLH